MFSVAESYDLLMGRWSRRLAPLLVRFADVRNGDHVLDIGSGTGALADAVATAAPSARVVGIDRSEPYVALARARHQQAQVRFEVGDAQHLQFDDACFDRTVSQLILNFIPDPEQALAEMIRVTRAGGIIATAVWDYGEGMEMLRAFWDEAVALHPDAEANDERHMPFSARGELAAFWRTHHLQGVSETALAIETPFSSFDDYWSPFLTQQGPAGVYVATLPERDCEQLRVNLRRRLLGDGADGPITLRARAWAVRGAVATLPLSPERSDR
jgi:SAM-dependent methyltransferase